MGPRGAAAPVHAGGDPAARAVVGAPNQAWERSGQTRTLRIVQFLRRCAARSHVN